MIQALIFIFILGLSFAVGSFLQAWLHMLLGHTELGGPLYRNHVQCHHTLYSGGVMTTPRYLPEEKTNTPFYLVPALVSAYAAHRFLPTLEFVAVGLGMGVSFVAQVYVHTQYHLVTSPLARFHWFLRWQRLHAVHHRDTRKNQSLLFPLWDKLFGTFESSETVGSGAKKAPRGPISSWLTGNLPDLQGDKLAFALRTDREIGGIVQYRLWNQPFFMISDPELIGEVLVTKNRNFTKPMPLKALAAVFGQGILTSETDLWRHERGIMAPAFHRKRIAAYAHVAAEATLAEIRGWEAGAERNLYADMNQLCLEIFSRSLLGETTTDQKAIFTECVQALQDSNREFTCLPKEKLPFATTRRLWRACKKLDVIVYGLIEDRRKKRSGGNDLVSLLVNAQLSGDPVVTDKQIRDEIVTLFLGGHETISAGIAWTLHLLSTHPAVEERVADEIDRLLAGRAPTFEDIGKLEYLGNVIKESMRLYPPAYQIGRVAIDDCEIGGYKIPAKAHVLMYQWAVHRSPKYFESPESFLPERWTNEMAQRLPKFAYFPFGGGPRICIGAAFATMETAVIVSILLQRFRLARVPGAEIMPAPALTLPLRDNHLPMRLEPRRTGGRPSIPRTRSSGTAMLATEV